MTETVRRRFPDHVEKIEELYGASPTFREVCNDHEEIRNVVQNRCQTGACDYAREVLEELEQEILESLEGKRKLLD